MEETPNSEEGMPDSPAPFSLDIQEVILNLAQHIIGCFAVIPGVLLLRKRYGERFLTPSVVVLTLFMLWGMAAAAGADNLFSAGTIFNRQGGGYEPPAPEQNTGGTGNLALPFLFAAVISALLAIRFLGIVQRFLRDDFSVHSRSDGEPFLVFARIADIAPPSLQPYLVVFLEVVVYTGVVCLLDVSRSTVFLLSLAAWGMFFAGHQFMLLGLRRSRHLDMEDKRWEVAALSREQDNRKQADYVPPLAAVAMDRKKADRAARGAFAVARSQAQGAGDGASP